MEFKIEKTHGSDNYFSDITRNFDLILKSFNEMNEKMEEESRRRAALEYKIMILNEALEDNKKKIEKEVTTLRDEMRSVGDILRTKNKPEEFLGDVVLGDVFGKCMNSPRRKRHDTGAGFEGLGVECLEQTGKLESRIIDDRMARLESDGGNSKRDDSRILPFGHANRHNRMRKKLYSLCVQPPHTKKAFTPPETRLIWNSKKIRTDLHALMDLVRKNREIKVSEAANKLGVDERSVLEFVRILESKKLVKFNYKIVGDSIIRT